MVIVYTSPASGELLVELAEWMTFQIALAAIKDGQSLPALSGMTSRKMVKEPKPVPRIAEMATSLSCGMPGPPKTLPLSKLSEILEDEETGLWEMADWGELIPISLRPYGRLLHK